MNKIKYFNYRQKSTIFNIFSCQKNEKTSVNLNNFHTSK